MAPAAAASVDASSKDPAKMSKAELLRLLKTTATEKEKLDKKCAKVQKKYKHTKKALNASQRPNESTAKELIPYPTGQTHGRGGYNVADDLFKKSGVTKEGYNTFITSVHQTMVAAGIPTTATWRVVRAGPLAEVLDVLREKFPWLGEYDADWPATTMMKQYLKNSRGDSRRKRRRAAVSTTAAA